MLSAHIIVALAVALAVTAALVDLRERRIPNKLTYPLMLAGLAAQTAFGGAKGLLAGLEGGLFFGGVFLLFYLVRAMGAGDVKLAAALGCIVGPAASLRVLIATALAGGILALIWALRARGLWRTVRNTFSVFGFHARFGLKPHPVINLDNAQAVRMPYGLAFAAGTLYWAASSLAGR